MDAAITIHLSHAAGPNKPRAEWQEHQGSTWLKVWEQDTEVVIFGTVEEVRDLLNDWLAALPSPLVQIMDNLAEAKRVQE